MSSETIKALLMITLFCGLQSRFDPDAGQARQALRSGFDASASPPPKSPT